MMEYIPGVQISDVKKLSVDQVLPESIMAKNNSKTPLGTVSETCYNENRDSVKMNDENFKVSLQSDAKKKKVL